MLFSCACFQVGYSAFSIQLGSFPTSSSSLTTPTHPSIPYSNAPSPVKPSLPSFIFELLASAVLVPVSPGGTFLVSLQWSVKSVCHLPWPVSFLSEPCAHKCSVNVWSCRDGKKHKKAWVAAFKELRVDILCFSPLLILCLLGAAISLKEENCIICFHFQRPHFSLHLTFRSLASY